MTKEKTSKLVKEKKVATKKVVAEIKTSNNKISAKEKFIVNPVNIIPTMKKVKKEILKKGLTGTVDEIKIADTKKLPTVKYHLVMKFNDKVVDKTTDDLFTAIKEEDPGYLKTKIIFQISNNNGSCERQVFVHKGRMMFRNRMFLETFIRHLIFKPAYNG